MAFGVIEREFTEVEGDLYVPCLDDVGKGKAEEDG